VSARPNLQPSPDLWTRFWVYAATPAPTGGVRLATVAQQMNMPAAAGFSTNDGLLALADQITSPGTTMLTTSTTAMPTDSWHCILCHVGASNIDAFVDGTQPPDLTLPLNTQTNPPLNKLTIGLSYQSRMMAAATDVWFDDVVVDTKDPGCGPP